MKFRTYNDVHEFYKDTYDVLMRHEAQNLIPLGNLLIGCEGTDKTGWRDPENWFMATVSGESGVLISAIMTPPHNIAIYATDNKIDANAMDCLIEGLGDRPIPGVIAEKSLAEYFAKAYTVIKSMNYEASMDQRIYELIEVNSKIQRVGTLRLLEEKDMPFFPFWLEAFNASERYGSTVMPMPVNEENYRYRLSSKKIYVLEIDGTPVTMAGFTREMQNVCGVAFVYTPPYYRGKGYATSCVAQLSQIALDKGFKKCVLYTDLANPTSNSIYQKIGYRAICDSLMLKFVSVKEDVKIIPYDEKYHGDMLFCYLAAKDAMREYAPKEWHRPEVKADLLDVRKGYIEKGEMFYLAIDENDRVVGMIGTRTSQTDLWLRRLFIKPEVKGKGVGSKLLEAACAYAEEKGVTAIHTRFAHWYEEAARFYPAKGFVEVESDAEHRRHMVKKIKGGMV